VHARAARLQPAQRDLCAAVQRCAPHRNIVRRDAILCGAVQYCASRCNIVRRGAPQWRARDAVRVRGHAPARWRRPTAGSTNNITQMIACLGQQAATRPAALK
jgi:hypothetical protein